MKLLNFSILCLLPGVVLCASPLKKVVLVDNMYNMTADPPLFKDRVGVRDLVKGEGAVLHTYRVTTVDGYITQLTHLIVKTPEEMKALPGKGIPVIMLHGFVATFDIYISAGRKMDLPFMFADQGFDVWLPDRRGNYYSRMHETLSKEDLRYWDFSIHESGTMDLPAYIDAVTQITGYPQVIFIGHSIAVVDFFIMMSSLPEYNDKILLGIQLAPVIYKKNSSAYTTPILRTAIAQLEPLYATALQLNMYECFPRRQSNINLVRQQCFKPWFREFCIDAFDNASGPHRGNIDRSQLLNILSRWPAGGGMKGLYHMGQIMKYGFRQVDYRSEEKNMEKYGTSTPPAYTVEKTTCPVAFFYGENDEFTETEQIKILAKKLPNTVLVKAVPDPFFNHVDFIFGKNRVEMLYNDVLQLSLEYASK